MMKRKIKDGNPFPYTGLNDDEVIRSRNQFGKNTFARPASIFWASFKKSFLDPIFLLLILSAVLYLLLNETAEAIYMAVAVVIIAFISFYQENRSGKALDALKKLTAKQVSIIRNGDLQLLAQEELVVGDYIVAEEGVVIPADGQIVRANDFSVNESMLTGEPLPVFKTTDEGNNMVYQGTTVCSGLAVFKATLIGTSTHMGKIARSLQTIRQEKSPLEKQIGRFVTQMSVIGISVFIMVWAIHYVRSGLWVSSLLQALTLAMSILPEEIPVAFSTFMAIGAWRLMQKGIVAKDIKTVEALGAATVICLDKTGTITENQMQLEQLYSYECKQFFSPSDFSAREAQKVITLGMWASEPVPFDNMEKNLHRIYGEIAGSDLRPDYRLEHEYPLAGRPPMMTHIFTNKSGERIIAAKGAPEKIISVSVLPQTEKDELNSIIAQLTFKGFRILAVAKGLMKEEAFPPRQEDFEFHFIGFLIFYDPPKKGIQQVFKQFYDAGIKIKMITGDNGETARAIAEKAGIENATKMLEGTTVMELNEDKLQPLLKHTNIFARMFPEAKLKVINAFKSMGQIVAMTGDGVNDAPALKAAHIGIAMGRRGAETAREAASLVLLEDDLGKMVDAIAMGRQISMNLKKAIRYIISIHIPIILVVTIPLVFSWAYPDVFSPVHVVFLELVMGPTCSIAFENDPADKYLMTSPPRVAAADLLSFSELGTAIIQGVTISGGAMMVYWGCLYLGQGENDTRALVFIMLISANIFLTFTDRSVYRSRSAWRGLNNNMLGFIVMTTLLLTVLIFLVPAIRTFFAFNAPSGLMTAGAGLTGALSVVWFEVVKRPAKRGR